MGSSHRWTNSFRANLMFFFLGRALFYILLFLQTMCATVLLYRDIKETVGNLKKPGGLSAQKCCGGGISRRTAPKAPIFELKSSQCHVSTRHGQCICCQGGTL